MSTLTASAVVVNDWWIDGARVGSRRKVVDVTLTLTGQGGLTNLIPASLLNLSSIDEVLGFRDSASVGYLAVPSYDGLNLVINQRAAQAITNGTFKSYVVTGLAATGNITATGAVAGDIVEDVIDLTTPAKLTKSQFTPGTDIITQASAAGDLHLLKLYITTRTAATVTSPAATPTDLTATVRCIVVGKE